MRALALLLLFAVCGTPQVSRPEAAMLEGIFRRDAIEFAESWNALMREWTERGTWNRKKAARVDKLWKALRKSEGWIQ